MLIKYSPGGQGCPGGYSFNPTVAGYTGTLTAGLVSWWSLDEASGTRADSVGSNDLSDNNTVGAAAGKNNNAASFVAANSEYLSLAAPAVNPSASDYTLAGWTYISETYTYPFSMVLGHYLVYYTEFGGTMVLKDQAGHQVNTADGDLRGIWCFWAVTFATATGATKLYTYGGTSAGTPATGTLDADNASAAAFRIGISVGGADYANQVQDETACWSRVLTDAEIAELYNGGTGFFYPFT